MPSQQRAPTERNYTLLTQLARYSPPSVARKSLMWKPDFRVWPCIS